MDSRRRKKFKKFLFQQQMLQAQSQGVGEVTAAMGGGISYILRDLFTTARAAGSVNGTLAEPGPGTRSVTDTGNNLAISGGRAVTTGMVAANDPFLGYGTLARVAGRTMKYTCKWTVNRGGGGWSDSSDVNQPILGVWDTSGQLTVSPPNLTGFQQFTTGSDYTLWLVLWATGGMIFAQGGGGSYLYSNPTLLWIDYWKNTDPMYVRPLRARAVNSSMEIDTLEVRDISSLATPQLTASVYQSSPSTGVNYTSVADALHYLTLTQAGSPTGGDNMELRYRMVDATNYWTAYLTWTGTQWDFKVDEVSAGVPTNHIDVGNVGGSIKDIAVVVRGNLHDAFTSDGTNWTKRGAQVNDATHNTATEGGAWFDSGSVSLLQSFARTWSL